MSSKRTQKEIIEKRKNSQQQPEEKKKEAKIYQTAKILPRFS